MIYASSCYIYIYINVAGKNHTLIITNPLGLQAVACHGPVAVHAEFLVPWSVLGYEK